MTNRPQAKDYPDEPVLTFLAALAPHTSAAWWREGTGASVASVFPPETPEKVILAKMRSMIKRGLVDGCPCGCRGNFMLAKRPN
jgi:hypothetical protein